MSPVSSPDVTPEGEDEETSRLGATDVAQSLARFEVYRARDEEWRWRLRHRNGNIIATSGQGYTRKHNALKGFRSVIANSADATIVEET
ncbi:YegP family protein [Halomicroarcula sp. GCM10025710]